MKRKPVKTTMNTPANLTELRNDLLEVYRDTRIDAIELSRAKELSNTAGKIIKSAGVQLDYAKARNEIPEIPFMK